jgi:tetratricopeptide (TPR) repeat protein
MAIVTLLSGRTKEAAGDAQAALSAYRSSADLDPSSEVGAEALYRRALLLESTGELRGALADLQSLSGRSGDYLWLRLARDRLNDLSLLLEYTDSLSGAGEDEEPVLRFLMAEKRMDLYGSDSTALSELRALRNSADARVRAMTLSLLAGIDGTPPDTSLAYLLQARSLADSGDLATRIEDDLSMPRGQGWPARPSAVLETAWGLIGEGEYGEAWEMVDRVLGTRWSSDARPGLLWAAYVASEGAAMDDGLVEGYVKELAERWPDTPEGQAAISRLGMDEGGGGGGGGDE